MTGGRASILIVDDERLVREFCARALSEYDVSLAASSEQALQIYDRERNDLVLTDVLMPGENGINLLRLLKEIDPIVPVIIMTGFTDNEILLHAIREGADDFINKPLNPLQLRTTVEKAFTKKYLKEELANLKQLDRLKTNFLSIISHKLRTPITAISLFLQNLQRGRCESGDEEFCRDVSLAREETDCLDRMVNDLILFSQMMESGKGLNLVACDLNQIILEVLYGSREAQQKPGIETKFTQMPLPVMRIDRNKIAFVLQQIVENAYKFSHDTGRVEISTAGSDELVTIVVNDSGIGIPQEEVEKVFDKFYQVDPDCTGQIRGFGLGLFYAREFIRQHDGTLAIESEAGRGTSVRIVLPVQ